MMAEYIERDKFIHFLFKEIAHFTETGQDTEIPVSSVLQSVVNELNKFETSDVQPVKHGKWLPIIEANEYGDAYQCGTYCSECGETLQSEPNFCPNCGARMDGDCNS